VGQLEQSSITIMRGLRRLRNAFRPNVKVVSMPDGVIADWNVPVRTRDGTILRANVFRPSSGLPVPAIASAHPYGKDKIPARSRSVRGLNFQYRLFPQPHAIELSEWTNWEAPDPAVWVPDGYAVVNIDLRGAGTSDGVGELLSDQEALDYYDVIEWIGTQSWCSGRVGLNGVSYLAISEYKVAALRPPHLAAICPWEGFTDLYRDFARPGGVREDGFTKVWDVGIRHGVRTNTRIRQEIVARPERDEWYKATVPDLERIEVPVLVCASFSDHSLHSRGSFEVFRRVGSPLKSLYTHRDGKWCAFYGQESTEIRRRFFEHTLKLIDNDWDHERPVRLAIYDAGAEPVAVLGEQEWPPHDLVSRTLALDSAQKTITEGLPVPAAAFTSFKTRRGSVRFTWIIPEDMDIIGPMALRLHVELRGIQDIFLFAGVRKFRDGAESKFEGSFGFSGDMVSKGWQRAAHRELDAFSTASQPLHTHRLAEPLYPGEIIPVDIALQPHATRFRKSDMLCVDVQGRWFFPKNLFFGQFPTTYQRSMKGICVLHTGGEYDAQLRLSSRPIDVGLSRA
jgi:predicted acyl esterase